MICAVRRKEIFVVEALNDAESGRRFLYETGSDWGPGYLTTEEISEAMYFETGKEAADWIRDNKRSCGWKMRPVRVHVRTRYGITDGGDDE